MRGVIFIALERATFLLCPAVVLTVVLGTVDEVLPHSPFRGVAESESEQLKAEGAILNKLDAREARKRGLATQMQWGENLLCRTNNSAYNSTAIDHKTIRSAS